MRELENYQPLEDDKKDETTFSLDGKRFLVTPKRWGILAITSVILSMEIFSLAFFAYVNDATSAYFRVDPYVADLLTTINMLSRGLFAFFIAYISDLLTFRRLAMWAPGAVTIASMLVAVGVSSRDNFPLVVMGQIIYGCGSTVALTLTQMASVNWFPKRDRGKAVSIPHLCRRLAMAVSSIAATTALDLKPSGRTNAITVVDEKVLDAFQGTYVIVYSALGAVAFFIFVAAQLFVTDHPLEVAVDNAQRRETSDGEKGWHLLTALKDLVLLFKIKSFLLILLFFSLLLSVRPVSDILLSSIVLEAFDNLNDQNVSIMFTVGLIAGASGTVFGGSVLDKFQKPICTFVLGKSGMMLSLALFAVALQIRSVALLYIGFVPTNLGRDFIYICISHGLVEAMESKTKSTRIKAFGICMSMPWVLTPIYTYLIRKTMDYLGPAVSVLFPLPFHLLAIILWILVWSKFRHGKKEAEITE